MADFSFPQDPPSQRAATRQLGAWFLGPKAENAELAENLFLSVLRDYVHWRKNYYPADGTLITHHMQREYLDFVDALYQSLSDMQARLRRNFPFYSPRYLAHQLSDQTLPAVLGYFAGMLYNANNVSVEAAPVTVEWELEVGHDILRMLGYRAPKPEHGHESRAQKEFGWAHITSGGTIANIEALWGARNICYFPIAVKRAVDAHDIALDVRLPHSAPDERHDLRRISAEKALGLRPVESIHLLARFVTAVQRHFRFSDEQASEEAWRILRETGLTVGSAGTSTLFNKWPPAIFVSGTAHYSLTKAVDLLGIGRDHLIMVDPDTQFRMDPRDLEQKMHRALDDGMFPLAIVAIAGTTEEGAVDPVHLIADTRRRVELERGQSSWLHIDAAWGGYIRALFVSREERDGGGGEDPDRQEEIVRRVNEFTSYTIRIKHGSYERETPVSWGSKPVTSAFLAFPQADSITVDPHKMGYIPYPCGVIAFRNDRVRHFLTQEAPYVTVTRETEAAAHFHEPPATVGPFILEGSKPGAAAAACLLSHRVIPPSIEGYGEIMRASLLGARELYERIIHWNKVCRASHWELDYQIHTLSPRPPDSNIVNFILKPKSDSSLESLNWLSEQVYRSFTIEAELGEREYSYSQPFFLSRTWFRPNLYPGKILRDFFVRSQVDGGDYEQKGLFVLRATVMSPYIVLAAETGRGPSYLGEFLNELHRNTTAALGQFPQREAGVVPPKAGH